MRWSTVAVTVGLAIAARANAQVRPDITGSVRGGYWSSTRDLDDRAPLGGAMLWLKFKLPLPSEAALYAEGWGALRGPPDRGDATAELREAYVTTSYGMIDLRMGRQILAWGRADGVNPTGNLTAEDLTLLAPDDPDRRLGTASAVLSGYLGGISLSGVWLPEFRGHRFPLPTTEGVAFGRDARHWPGDQWAFRAEHTGGSLDWSASVFRGLDLLPDLEPGATAGAVSLRHRPITAIGADAAMNVGRFGLRAEGAFTRTADRKGTDPFTRNPFAFLVVGGDRTWAGRVNLNVQYLARIQTRFRDVATDTASGAGAIAWQQAVLSNQTRRVQQGASMRASVKWLRETLETEWAAVTYSGPRGVAVRPKVTYAVNDMLTVIGGAEVFRGSDASIFRLLRPNSVVYTEMRWSF